MRGNRHGVQLTDNKWFGASGRVLCWLCRRHGEPGKAATLGGAPPWSRMGRGGFERAGNHEEHKET